MDSSQTDSCILCLVSACGSQAKPAWFDQVASDKCSLRNEDTVMIVEFGYQGYMMYNKATAPDFFNFWSSYSSSYLLFNYHIQFSFQTTANTGIFFYAQPKSTAAAHIKIDFLSGYMSGGKITHKIKNGAATTEDSKLTTTKTYNDGKWHFGSFYKQQLYQQLCIDDECLEETIPGVSDAANAEEKVFFGGVPSSIQANVNYNIGTTSSFEGYVANITISSKALPPAVTCLNVTAPKIN